MAQSWIKLYVNDLRGEMREDVVSAAASFVVVCDGAHGAVRMEAKVHREYVDATAGTDRDSRKRRIHLERSFRAFCEHDDFTSRLPPEKLRREDSLKDGRGGYVAVWAFKARHIRIYGTLVEVAGKRCFAGTTVDTSKKQDSADQALLSKAAQKGGELSEYGQRTKNERQRAGEGHR